MDNTNPDQPGAVFGLDASSPAPSGSPRPASGFFGNRRAASRAAATSPASSGSMVSTDSSLNPAFASAPQSDIFLSSPHPTKSKKPLILVIIIIAILILAGVLAVIFIAKPQSATVGNVQDNFNAYANFVLYGKNSTEPITIDRGDETTYYYDEIWNSGLDNIRKFYTDSEKLVTNLKASVQNWDTENAKEQQSAKWILHQVQIHEYLALYYHKGAPNYSDFVRAYHSGGADAVKQYAKDFYATSITDNPFIAKIQDSFMQAAEAAGESFAIYSKYGCLGGSSANNICLEQNASVSETSATANDFQKYQDFQNQLESYRDFNSSLVQNIFTVTYSLAGGNNG